MTRTATVHCGTQRNDESYNRALWNTACMMRTATVRCGTRTQPCIVEHIVHGENCNRVMWIENSTVHCGTQRA